MESGPEPQELFEQTERSHHAAHHAEDVDEEGKRFTMRAAITASVLAVGAALGSLLSGHAANEAILKTIESSDKWSYYQATSTKAHIFEGNKALLSSVVPDATTPGVRRSLEAFDTKLNKYEKQKEDTRREAESLAKVSIDEFAKHQNFSLAVAAFQIGIVLSSVSILAKNKWLYFGSIVAGATGLGFCIYGVLMR